MAVSSLQRELVNLQGSHRLGNKGGAVVVEEHRE
jgi:hypothetical protein